MIFSSAETLKLLALIDGFIVILHQAKLSMRYHRDV
jgi:hypothetical protein